MQYKVHHVVNLAFREVITTINRPDELNDIPCHTFLRVWLPRAPGKITVPLWRDSVRVGVSPIPMKP